MSLESGSPVLRRREELDILRGVLLVLMAVTHLPTRLSLYSSQPFGFVSAAEGFVFLSAFLVGSTYSRKLVEHGSDYVRARLWQRAGKLYIAHLALLLFAFTIVAAIAVVSGRPALRNHLSVYFDTPVWAAIGGPLLLYQPPLLDILPMYIVFLVLTPPLLKFAARRGWWPLLTLSGLLWVFAQLDGRRLVYGNLSALAGLTVPIDAFGAFDWFAWQLVWVAGLWFGTRDVRRRYAAGVAPVRRLPLLLTVAVATTVAFFIWRYHSGFEIDAVGNSSMFDKWHLGPLRVLNFAALAYVVSHFVLPGLGELRLRILSMLGRASLAVFTAHVPFVVLSRGLIIDDTTPLTIVQEVLVLAFTFAAMLIVAWRSGGRARARSVARAQAA
jgi:hypothetical protein